jgi:biotin operon repressor
MHTEKLDYDPRSRWGIHLIDKGFCIFPEQIIKRWGKTGLDPTDLAIVLTMAAYWWAAERRPFPSLETISKNLGISRRTVERRIKKMVELGYIKRKKREVSKNSPVTTEYDLSGLIKRFEAM